MMMKGKIQLLVCVRDMKNSDMNYLDIKYVALNDLKKLYNIIIETTSLNLYFLGLFALLLRNQKKTKF